MTYRLSGRLLNKGLMGAVAALLLLMSLLAPARAELVQFVYTSDQHYGITRKAFRGLDKVSSREVNAAMVQAINTLPGISLPEDGGVRAGQPVQWADAVISTGDIANRMEGTDERLIPSATECWALFEKQYINGLSLKDRAGKAAEVLAIPGNHDVTNAVGFYKAMTPAKDNGSLLAMYNRANNTSLAPEAFDAKRDKVFLNREYGGVRLLFVQMWPDSAARAWLDAQLANVPSGKPVLLFTHDQPDIEAKHLINPNGSGDINAKDKFENLKAQAWQDVADRMRNTFNAVTKGHKFKASDLISISGDLKKIEQLKLELSTPRKRYSKRGLDMVETKDELARRSVASHNLADAFVMGACPHLVANSRPIRDLL